MYCSEFDIINIFFKDKQKNKNFAEIGIGDDCAVIKFFKNERIAVTIDTLIENVHFYSSISPEDLAYKSIAVNLSDLASMGATPKYILIALTLNEINENWLYRFSREFFNQIESYGMQLIGGDTTKGPMSLTYTVYGFISNETFLTRSGACDNDLICVTGTIGDSAAGLDIIRSNLLISDLNYKNWLIKKHLRPIPRIKEGKMLCKFASSCIDISDGLISDLSHILKASNCGAIVNLDSLPLSYILCKCVSQKKAIIYALKGGEDYELCFTINRDNLNSAIKSLLSVNCKFKCIGFISKNVKGVHLFYKKKEILLNFKGFDHFS